MLKRILLLLSCVAVNGLFAQTQLNTSKVSQVLQEKIEAFPNAYHHFYILLEDKIDVRTMDEAFYRNKVTLQNRTRTIIHALKTKAITTQKPILAFLANHPNANTQTIESFWAVNAIFVKAKADVIADLSQRNDVELLDFNAELKLEEYTNETTFMPPAPNDIEPGLAAINAPKLWQIGYTGYGRKALIIDTGVDPTHPALSTKYWGNQVGDVEAWYNHTGNTPTPFDCGDHGTHVTGTILGLDRNTSDTIGVAFGANWMGSPGICGNGIGSTVASFQWAIDPDGDSTTTNDQPDVINNSWYAPSQAGMECTSIYISLLAAVEAAGIAVVFSAGNAGPSPSTITPPKNINWDLVNVFAVGALNGNSTNLPIASFSSRGPSICPDTGSLLIKPEVSAPGQSVRSCEPGGIYGTKSGTSMAAPHASGAILLLKEAFPYLTGTEIKLALYFSATDLGAVGEDNTFGMGIIDVFSAYNYLINQGNTPISPFDTNDVVMGGVSGINNISCNNNITPAITLINGGLDTLFSATIVYTISNGLIDSILWTGSLLPLQSSTVLLPTTNLSSDEYTFSADLKMPNGVPDLRDFDNHFNTSFYISNDKLATTIGDTICIGGEAVLKGEHADGDGTIYWYSNSNFGNVLDTGATFITPSLGISRTYYADYTRQKSAGKLDSAGNGGMHHSLDRYLIFDAHRPFLLKSVKVYAENAGGRLIQLRDENGANIFIKPSVLQAGEQRINLNFNIPRGKDYQLGVGANSGLYRNQGNLNYPYKTGDAVTIKGTNAGNPTGAYYYFYDWEIEYTNICGRTKTSVEVMDSTHTTVFGSSVDSIDINLTSGTVFFADSSIDAVSWYWDFGNGSTSTLSNPSTIYTTPGIYEVVLQTESNFGCSDVAKKTIVVTGLVATTAADYAKSINVFPNPSSGQFNVVFDLNNNQKVNMWLLDVLGRAVKNYGTSTINQQAMELDLSNLEKGIYYLRMDIEGILVVKKLVKI